MTELRVVREVPEWHELGACKLFPELDWVDAKNEQALACRLICRACPVRLECATGALERRERWGIWGGLDYHDRKRIAAKHGYLPPGDVPEHGTNARRVKWGCTCPDCKRAHAVYEYDRRNRKRRTTVWSRPLLALTRTCVVGRRRLGVGQLLLPFPGIGHPDAAPEPTGLEVAA